MAEVILVVLLIVVGIAALLFTLLAIFGTAMGRVTSPYSGDLTPAVIGAVITIICLGGAAAFIFT